MDQVGCTVDRELRKAQSVFGLLALGDIAHHALDALRRAGRVDVEVTVDRGAEHAAVAATQFNLVVDH